MTEAKRKVPALRFPEFVGEWRNGEIGDIGDIVSGGTPESTNSSYWTGTIPWFTPTEIKNKYIDNSERKITEEGLKKSSAKLLPTGSILLTTRASIGDMSISNVECATNQGFQSIVVNNDFNNEFAFYLIGTQKKELLRKACGSTFLEISKSELAKIKTTFPRIDEQKKIADFLSSVDERIGLLKRRKEQLETYKRGVMQQIFSRRLRFKDSYGSDYPEWQDVRFGDITKKFTSKNKALIDAPVYSVTNYDGFILQETHFDSKIAIGDLTGYKIVRKGDFAYNPARINVGSIGHFSENVGVISSLYVCFRTDKRVTDQFFSYLLQLEKTKYQICNLGEGGVRIYLWYELFAMVKCQIPCIEEQQKITDFLSAIDNKIELCEKQIADTEKFKKGLLQQMFV